MHMRGSHDVVIVGGASLRVRHDTRRAIRGWNIRYPMMQHTTTCQDYTIQLPHRITSHSPQRMSLTLRCCLIDDGNSPACFTTGSIAFIRSHVCILNVCTSVAYDSDADVMA